MKKHKLRRIHHIDIGKMTYKEALDYINIIRDKINKRHSFNSIIIKDGQLRIDQMEKEKARLQIAQM